MLLLWLEPKTFHMSGGFNNQYTTKYMYSTKEQRKWMQKIIADLKTIHTPPLHSLANR